MWSQQMSYPGRTIPAISTTKQPCSLDTSLTFLPNSAIQSSLLPYLSSNSSALLFCHPLIHLMTSQPVSHLMTSHPAIQLPHDVSASQPPHDAPSSHPASQP
ncbi:hypothetical protein Pmani_036123 [Petrolisthes manimaculis]|uniref:Uncharacterized protein n=1 Tax=Petrolisthes manimaculis TaxID=1843537 RepID=A0AAE1NKU2_9EUCA|nr:hypothetical protein Pmani_036123 [Petrolisthes manimaculis]